MLWCLLMSSSVMHFEIDLEEISKAANFVHSIVKGSVGRINSTNPDHRAVFISATPEGLVLRCTTQDYQASVIVDAEIFTFGECMVETEPLAKFLDAQPEDSLMTFSYDNSQLYVESDKVKGTRNLPAYDPDMAMPEWRLESDHFEAVVPPDFAEEISYTARFASTDESKSFFGINIDETGILALDGYEFVKIPRELEGLRSTTLHPEVAKLMPSPKDFGDGDIKFASDGQRFRFSFGDSKLSGPLAAADFTQGRALIETIIEGYMKENNKVCLKHDYKKFGFLLNRMNASCENHFDRVLFWPNGLICIGIDSPNNYNEYLEPLDNNMNEAFALNLKSLNKMFKEGKDEELVFNFDPDTDRPQDKSVVIIAGRKIIGFSPSVVAAEIVDRHRDNIEDFDPDGVDETTDDSNDAEAGETQSEQPDVVDW